MGFIGLLLHSQDFFLSLMLLKQLEDLLFATENKRLFNNGELELINLVNKALPRMISSRSYDESAMSNVNRLFKYRCNNDRVENSIERLIRLYREKINEYISSPQCLSADHLEICYNRYANISAPKSVNLPGYCDLNLSHYAEELDVLCTPILSHLHKEFQDGTAFPAYNVSPQSELAKYIRNIVINDPFIYKSIKNIVGILSRNQNLQLAGQVKLHPPSVDMVSSNWHLDGDPRYCKILLYLDTLSSNDGAFKVSPWSMHSNSLILDHFSAISLMIPHEDKLKAIHNSNLSFLPIMLLLGDRCFAAFKSIHPLNQYITFDVKKYTGAVFNGVILPHSGGGNTRFFRPVLQLMVWSS